MKQLTQSEIRKNGKVYKNVSSPETSGTMKQVTDIVENNGTFSISTDGGKTYSPASGAVPEALPQEASALKSGKLPTSGWTETVEKLLNIGYVSQGNEKYIGNIPNAYSLNDGWYAKKDNYTCSFNVIDTSIAGKKKFSSSSSDWSGIYLIVYENNDIYVHHEKSGGTIFDGLYNSNWADYTYTISDTSITANSDILMELTDDGGVKAYSMEAGKMTVIRDTVPTSPIPYTYKVKQTNASGQFTLVNHFVPNVPVTSVNGQTGAVTGLATTDEVNKKQNMLTETQLAAVNSGITEAKRTKYDGYEATINQKANSADLAQVATSGSYNALKDKPTIPPAITESVVSGWGFTKNKGTVNSIKMNGKPVTITDGAVDLGTVITSHQSLDSKQDKITSSNKLDASLVSGLAKVATTGSYTDLSNTPTILSEEDVKGIKVNNATNADSAGYVKNSIVCQGVGMNADANYSNFVTYDGSAARSIKFYKYDFQMLDALGSGDAELTLRNTGVTAGTYNSVTVDTKGRVTAGTNTPAVDTDNFVPKSAFSLSGTTLTITI